MSEGASRKPISAAAVLAVAVIACAIMTAAALWPACAAQAAQLAAGAEGQASVTAQGAPSVQPTTANSLIAKKYKIRAKLNVKKNRLDMTVIVTVKNNTRKSFKQLYFRNMAATMIKQARASTAINEDRKTKVKGARNLTAKRKLKFTTLKRDRSIIKVKLGKKKLKPGKTARIQLKLSTGIPEWNGRLSYTKTKQGKMYVLTWCFPTLADYRAGKWSLSPLPKTGENRFARPCAYDVTITAPKSYKVATSGASTTKKGKTRVKASNLRDFAAVACNFMKSDVAYVRGVKVVNWYLPGAYSARYRADTMPALKDAVAYMTDHVGALPYGEIDAVQTFGSGTNGAGSMEYTGLVTLSGDRYYYARPEGESAISALTLTAYHETVHQWFYATVGNDEFAEPWLDEGITSFYNKYAVYAQDSETVRYLASRAGKSVDEYLPAQRESARASFAAAEKTSSSPKLARNASAFPAYFTTVYGVGPHFLCQLQDALGDAEFESAMRDYYATYTLKEATSAGFAQVMRRHAPDDAADQVDALIAKYL